MDNQISTPSGGNAIVISPDDSSVSLAQAIYHHITTKTERVLESFRESYVVSCDDVIQLCHALKQAAQRHHEGEWSCVIDHSIFKKSRTRYSLLERFKLADKGQAEPTGELVVTYDFLSKNPFSPTDVDITPERYKLVIRITQEPYLSMLDDEDSRPSFINRLISFPSITASVQYVDYTVARAMLSAIRDWVSALEKNGQSKYTRLFLKNEISFSSLLPSVLAAAILLGAAGVSYHIERGFPAYILSSVALSVLLYGAGSMVTETIMASIYKLQVPTVMLITKGNATHRAAIFGRRKKSKQLLSLIFGAVLLAVIINVSSSFLYSWLVK